MQALHSGKSALIMMGFAHLNDQTGFLNFFKSQGYCIKHALAKEDFQPEINRMVDFDEWIQASIGS